MTTLEEYREVADKIKHLAGKGSDITKEEAESFPELKKRRDDLQNILATAEAIAAAEGENKAFLTSGAGKLEHPSDGKVAGLAGFGKADVVEVKGFNVEDMGPSFTDRQIKAMTTPGYDKAFEKYIRCGGRMEVLDSVAPDARKMLQEGIDTAGGYVVGVDMLNQLIQRKPTPTRVSGQTMQLTCSSDRKIMPKVIWTDDIYTTGIRLTWTGENPSSATASRVTDPVFGTVNIPIFTALMSLPITRDMLEDASFNLQAYVVAKFAETIALAKDNMTLVGTGVNQPSGILLNVGSTNPPGPRRVASGSSTGVTLDSLIDMSYSLPEQYDENAVYVMNKTQTARTIAKIKDGQGRPLWGTGVQDSGIAAGSVKNRGRYINEYPVDYSGFMPNIAANAYPILFGDLTGYYTVDRIGMTIQVLNEKYAETNMVVLLARIRWGGQVAEEWKFTAMQIASS